MSTQNFQTFSSTAVNNFHSMVTTERIDGVSVHVFQFSLYIECQCAYCVDASVFPSGLKAAAIVDLGRGNRGQYLADQ